MTGAIFDIQRFSLHDGPGIRTTVFLKGCNMRCPWCHNPESFSMAQQLSVRVHDCSRCLACEKACGYGVHQFKDGERGFLDGNCSLCGRCIAACPLGLISVIGKTYTADDVIAVVMRDMVYYEHSGGGVTFSGGEPLVQYAFLLELLAKSKQYNLHTCLETNGLMSKLSGNDSVADAWDGLYEYVDLILFDFKHSDETAHKELTGAPLDRVLESLGHLNRLCKPILLRCPIIPGINDTDGHFGSIRDLLAQYPSIQKAEIIPYHSLGSSKWANLGLVYGFAHTIVPTEEQINEWKSKI